MGTFSGCSGLPPRMVDLFQNRDKSYVESFSLEEAHARSIENSRKNQFILGEPSRHSLVKRHLSCPRTRVVHAQASALETSNLVWGQTNRTFKISLLREFKLRDRMR